MNLNISEHEKAIILNCLNSKECDLINQRVETERDNGDTFPVQIELDDVQILLAKVEATKF